MKNNMNIFRVIAVCLSIAAFLLGIGITLGIFMPLAGYVQEDYPLFTIGYAVFKTYGFSAFLIPLVFLYASVVLFIPGWSHESAGVLLGVPLYFITAFVTERVLYSIIRHISIPLVKHFAVSSIIICGLILICVEIFMMIEFSDTILGFLKNILGYEQEQVLEESDDKAVGAAELESDAAAEAAGAVSDGSVVTERIESADNETGNADSAVETAAVPKITNEADTDVHDSVSEPPAADTGTDSKLHISDIQEVPVHAILEQAESAEAAIENGGHTPADKAAYTHTVSVLHEDYHSVHEEQPRPVSAADALQVSGADTVSMPIFDPLDPNNLFSSLEEITADVERIKHTDYTAPSDTQPHRRPNTEQHAEQAIERIHQQAASAAPHAASLPDSQITKRTAHAAAETVVPPYAPKTAQPAKAASAAPAEAKPVYTTTAAEAAAAPKPQAAEQPVKPASRLFNVESAVFSEKVRKAVPTSRYPLLDSLVVIERTLLRGSDIREVPVQSEDILSDTDSEIRETAQTGASSAAGAAYPEQTSGGRQDNTEHAFPAPLPADTENPQPISAVAEYPAGNRPAAAAPYASAAAAAVPSDDPVHGSKSLQQLPEAAEPSKLAETVMPKTLHTDGTIRSSVPVDTQAQSATAVRVSPQPFTDDSSPEPAGLMPIPAEETVSETPAEAASAEPAEHPAELEEHNADNQRTDAAAVQDVSTSVGAGEMVHEEQSVPQQVTESVHTAPLSASSISDTAAAQTSVGGTDTAELRAFAPVSAAPETPQPLSALIPTASETPQPFPAADDMDGSDDYLDDSEDEDYNDDSDEDDAVFPEKPASENTTGAEGAVPAAVPLTAATLPEVPVPAAPRKKYSVPFDLLTHYPDGEYWVVDDATRKAAFMLKSTFSEFKIDVSITGIRKGPVVTMFEMLPPPGIKLSKITNLQDNIALRLAASSVRIVAPIPGKHAVGIEVPNKKRSIVSFRELIETDLPESAKMAIPVVLGKDVTGNPQLLDLAQTPHLLIAGATGSGKSVCVNTIILSILYNRRPDEVKLILVDPKIVELKLYNDIAHLLAPVITEPKRAFQALQYSLCEMERRYALLDGMGVRDIKTYNKKIKAEHIAAEELPYIVVIIDEFADLMATSGKELEATVARLCAMSRAVGIHLVLATQRPSIDVITGLIKANIPTRIAFMVASKTDSRIILDEVGAEKLLGKGDMLYVSAAQPFPARMQGAFVSEEEVERVVACVKDYCEPEYIDDEIFVDDDDDSYEHVVFSDDNDPLYEQALEIVTFAGKASASYVQRKLKIGYNRAARLIEEMEANGIVGPANGSKPREILRRS